MTTEVRCSWKKVHATQTILDLTFEDGKVRGRDLMKMMISYDVVSSGPL